MTLAAGAPKALLKGYSALVYALAGHGTVGGEARPIREGRLAPFGAGDALRLAADRVQDSRSPSWSSSCWAVGPSANPSSSTARL
ncbi:hypothetical protein GCM10010307_68180 [Streptomyces vastus]|uniref:Uncharacterized protein n=1 Tax=Streptomyces vastus TaxID=285451 RepID=A0ABN3RL61_9ACTN